MWKCARCQQQVSICLLDSSLRVPMLMIRVFVRVDHPKHPAYQATGGYCRQEAILILRRFYITENSNGLFLLRSVFLSFTCIGLAPVPRSKANRVLKLDIADTAPGSVWSLCLQDLPASLFLYSGNSRRSQHQPSLFDQDPTGQWPIDKFVFTSPILEWLLQPTHAKVHGTDSCLEVSGVTRI